MYEITNEPKLYWYHKILLPLMIVVGLSISLMCLVSRNISELIFFFLKMKE